MTSTGKPSGRELIITRTFDAPRALVWKAWTDPEHFRRWWGPKDFTAPAATMDVRVGGRYLNCMRGPDGKEYWTAGQYLEVVPLERLVYTDAFADAEGNWVSPEAMGMPGAWPDEFHGVVTVTFEDDHGRTKMTLRHAGIPSGEMEDMTNSGWNESFDKLGASLA